MNRAEAKHAVARQFELMRRDYDKLYRNYCAVVRENVELAREVDRLRNGVGACR